MLKVGDIVVVKGQPPKSYYLEGGCITKIDGDIAIVWCDGQIHHYDLKDLRQFMKQDGTLIGNELYPKQKGDYVRASIQ